MGETNAARRPPGGGDELDPSGNLRGESRASPRSSANNSIRANHEQEIQGDSRGKPPAVVGGGRLCSRGSPRLAAGISNRRPPRSQGNPGRPPGAVYRPAKQWTGSEYARAWKALRSGIYTTRERVRLQRDLLERWAEVDLAAAIEAALGEAWDRDGGSEFDPSGPLLDVFSEALAKNPQEGWDMIRGRQFGVGTGMLRRVWMEAVGMSDPLFLANRVAELSWRDRPLAIEICQTAVQIRSGRSDGSGTVRGYSRDCRRKW